MMRTDISACDHCGRCCREAPCLIGSPEELKHLPREHLQVEQTNDGFQVRISAAPCVYWNGQCTINTVKPKGGRDFECWTPETFKKMYFWTPAQLAEIGFRT